MVFSAPMIATAAPLSVRWGTVVDSVSGTPVAGAEICDPETGKTVTTGPNGAFVLQNPGPRLTVHRSGYQPTVLTPTGPTLAMTRGPNLAASKIPLSALSLRVTLVPIGATRPAVNTATPSPRPTAHPHGSAPAMALRWGTVIDGRTGLPVEGAEVRDGDTGQSVSTGKNGGFVLQVSGKQLTVQRAGYQSTVTPLDGPSLVISRGPKPPTGKIPLSALTITIRLMPAEPARQALWGRVVAARDQIGIVGARLQDPDSGATTETIAGGYFFLFTEAKTLIVERAGFRPQTVAVTGRRLQLGSGVPTGPTVPLAAVAMTIALDGLRAPLLGSQLTLSWAPDLLSEDHRLTDGTQFLTDGLRLQQGRLEGAARLAPVYLSGIVSTSAYAMLRDDTGAEFLRRHTTGELAAFYTHTWDERFSVGLGPSLLADAIAVSDLPPTVGRGPDYLDANLTRWGLGLGAVGAMDLPLPWLTSVDARLGLWPITGQLESIAGLTGGYWSMAGSVALRTYPWQRLGFEVRYLYHGWQSSNYNQGHHGGLLGVTYAF